MKITLKTGSVTLAVLTWMGLCLIAAPAAPAPAREMNLLGTFVWSNEPIQKHELRAKLTATTTNEWQAVWTFNWKQHPMTFTGTVKGNLRTGPVTGTGDSPDGKRRFTFDGTAKDGVIDFSHYEITRGKNRTGNGEMRVVN